MNITVERIPGKDNQDLRDKVEGKSPEKSREISGVFITQVKVIL